MDAPSRKSRLDDVASRAGVSTATVSRYFNNRSVVAPATAERIEVAVRELGYVPNLVAGALATSRSRLVAVLVPYLADSIFASTIEAMVDELYAQGMVPMLGITMAEQRTHELIQAALSRRADAVILTGIVTDAGVRDALRCGNTTVVETWGLPDDPIDLAVGFSHREAGAEIARFLTRRGYRAPHLVTSKSMRAQHRRDSFVKEWSHLGGAEPTEDATDVLLQFGHARAAFAKLKRLDPMPDVVVCGSDSLAQGVIIEAMAAGMRVPEDIAVVGFGNSLLASDMRPTITTVDVDGARIAREAIAALRQAEEGKMDRPRSIDVGFKLIARESA